MSPPRVTPPVGARSIIRIVIRRIRVVIRIRLLLRPQINLLDIENRIVVIHIADLAGAQPSEDAGNSYISVFLVNFRIEKTAGLRVNR